MVDEVVAFWRQVLKDAAHPLHRAAWLLFNDINNIEYAARALQPVKADLLPRLYDILDDEELYLEGSFGNGYGPYNAVRLLGEWRVAEALPRLLRELEQADEADDDDFYEAAIDAVKKLGPEVVSGPLLALAHEKGNPRLIWIDSTLADIAVGDPEVFDWLVGGLDLAEASKHEWDIAMYGEHLLVNDHARAEGILRERISQRRYSKELTERLENYIENLRDWHARD